MLKELSPPDSVTKHFVYDHPESRRSKFAKFLVKRILRLGQRYDRLPLYGPRFDRSKMIHDLPRPGRGVSITTNPLGPCNYLHLTTSTNTMDKAVLYLHGGGFVEGPALGHCLFVKELCVKTSVDVYMLDYPKAPEHSAKEMLDAVHAMYIRLCQQFGARNIVVMGDSAGGALTFTLAQLLKQRSQELPASLILLSPSLDVRFENPEMHSIEPHDPLLTVKRIQAMRDAYLSRGGDPTDPLISPLFGDLKGLPPVYLFMGTHDLLVPDARRLFERAKREQASLEYYEFENMMHVWMLFTFAEAQAARQRIYEIVGTAT